MKNNRRNTKRMLSGRILYYIVWLMVLASCATRMNSAPIFDLSKSFEDLTKLPSDKKNPVTPVSSSLPGLYRVKPGDTLYRIALENKESYQNLIEWNNIENPSRIEINQLLRITPPDNPVTTHVTSVIPYTSEDISSPLLTKNGHSTVFMWPTCGKVINSFDGLKNKGIDIAGIAGQPIRAVANGRVVYAGNSLRGYGNLIIIKHDDIYLTAYAHNHVLVAKEGDIVLMGQKIAEMGDSDANHVMLHFEVRRCGKPVDPLKYISRP